MSKKKLPIGIQTFSEIIEQNHCYVDKTPLIAQLVDSGKYYFLSRPRRFGKSLLISTLAAAFAGQKTLFQGLYLEHHWDWSVTYPVIHLSLGAGIAQTAALLEQQLQERITSHAQRYQITLQNQTLSGRFRELIETLHQQYQQLVVILIDEYDKPILDHIENPELAVTMREGLKNLYSVLKDSDAHIKFVLLTGVSKFSKVSLFSGLNNLEDITLSPDFATLCGYTETEIKTVFGDYLAGVDFDELRAWYNGYNFLGEKVYNPFDVLLFLKNRVFKNYWFETGSPSFLLKLIQERHYYIPELERSISNEALLSSFDVNDMELETLLYQTGYLTIDSVMQQGSRQVYTLTYPNREIKMSFADVLLRHFSHAPRQQQANLSAMYHALTDHNCARLHAIFQAFFASIPHDWYRKNQLAQYEGYYASIVYCYFAALGFTTIAEDVTNQGCIDLTVILDDSVYILEFKVVTAAQGQALTQIQQKNYQQKYLHSGKAVYLLGVEFNAEERNIVGFEWTAVKSTP